MYHFFVSPEECGSDTIMIAGDDYNHIRNVLRLRIGDPIAVSDGIEREYLCRIEAYEDQKVVARIEDVCGNNAELQTELVLYQGYPKSDKLEMIIQKAVELGAARIVPVMTRRTVVKLDEKKAGKRVERLNAIAQSAAKQSGRTVVPVVDRVMTFSEALKDASELEMILIPYENAEGIAHSKEVIHNASNKRSVGIFIGPEGGFEEREVEDAMAIGAECITLGHRILRTETAGMSILSILMFELEND